MTNKVEFSLNEKRQAALKAKTRKTAVYLVKYLLIFGIAFVIVYPLLVKLSVSFMSESDLSDLTVKWIPKHFSLDNYKKVLEALNIKKAFFNSLFYTVVITFLQILACTLAAYGLARYPYPGSKIVLMLIIFTLVVPPQTYMSAQYIEFRFFNPLGLVKLLRGTVGVNNTLWPFVIQAVLCQGLRNGLYIFLIYQYFRNLPKELEEAADVDGAGPLRAFFSVILANSVPILVTVGVLSVVWQWNDNYNNSLLAGQLDFISINVGNISSLLRESAGVAQDHIAKDSLIMSAYNNAASMLMIAPILLFFAVVQRSFSANLSRTGIVG